jgi:nickel/cobalt transporter (NicO) family protein
MSSATLSALCGSALAIGVFHTLLGPDHYLPFVALSKARAWSRRRTLLVTAGFGLAHTLGTVLLGAAGLALGLQLGWLESIEALRGDLAALGLLGIGLAYTGWAVWRLLRHRHTRHHTPTYTHIHEGAPGHSHEAGSTGALHVHGFHRHPHAHRHDLPAPVLSWGLFLVFVFGPCEALIPLLMYPAAHHDALGVAMVTLVFVLATVGTMLTAVSLALWGLNRLKVESLTPYADVLAGATLTICGGAILAGL